MIFRGWMITNQLDQYFNAYSGGIIMPNVPTTATAMFSQIHGGADTHPIDTTDGVSQLSSLLDFEDQKDWISNIFSLVPKGNSNSGNSCLCTKVGGYGTLASIPFSSLLLGSLGDSISLSIKVDENPPNPWWLGTIKMQVFFPSSALSFNLGEVTLIPSFISQWKELSWIVPAEMKRLLEYESKDIRIELTLNGNGHVICLDHIVSSKGNGLSDAIPSQPYHKLNMCSHPCCRHPV